MIRPKWSTHTVLLFGLVVLFTSLGCGGGGEKATTTEVSSDTPHRGGTIVRRLESECKTLNWVLFSTAYENYVLRYLYDPLIEVDEKLEYQPVLAESWKISDDHLRITVRLRDNIRWHDGVPITSKDVKFTMDKIKDPAIPALNKEGYFDKLDHIEVVDDRTVVFVWKEPYAPSLYAITQVWPIPEHIYGKGDFLTNPANRAPVGSGPFKFAEWKTSQYIKIVRNDDYWGKKAYLDAVIFRVIEDDAVALHAMRAGEIDEMRATQIQWEKQTNDKDFLSRFNKYHYYIPSYNYLGWNCRSVWFNDKRVRLAMTLLFDRESINAKIYSGFAKLVSGPFYINSWSYDRTVKPHPFDPQRAKQLLDEAGWIDHDHDGVRDKDGVKFEFEMLITTSNTAQQFAQLLQEECGKAGVIVKIRQLEGATFFDRVDNGEFDSCALGWGLDLDPDIYDTFHSSMVPPVGLNHGFYSNPVVDSLLEAGRVEFDQEKRAQIYHQIHRILHEDQPYTFVNAVPEKRPISKRIKGVVISPNGPFNFYPGADYWYIDDSTTPAVADGQQ
jgi:peptide/nickel transport system substrate-binding protein